MIAANKFESFCVEPSERWLFAGDYSGQIAVVDIDPFRARERVQAHAGAIHSMKAHASLPYIAALSTDRTASIWRYDRDTGAIARVCAIPLRDMRAPDDPPALCAVRSTSQALGLHDTKRRLLTRTGNAALAEIEFDDDGGYRVLYCARYHGDADLISARYAQGSDLVLTGSIDGEIVLSQGGAASRSWRFGTAACHWLEHLSGSTYLLASDMRYVGRLDISGERESYSGVPFTRDDLEQVTYNRASKRAFVASFDRTIYEIDTERLSPKRVAFKPPYKCRWLRTLERSPSTLLVQCRNGGLYKADVDTGEELAVIKDTPDALWTGATLPDGALLLAGEGDRLLKVRPTGALPTSRLPTFSLEAIPLAMPPASFTKRLALQPGTSRVVLGRSSGDLVAVDGASARVVCNLGAAIRDVAVRSDRPEAYAACEDGGVHRVHLDSGEVLASFHTEDQPIWSLAHAASTKGAGVVAAGERKGCIYLLSDDDLAPTGVRAKVGRPKRMKWVDENTLLHSYLDEIYKLDRRTGESVRLVASVGNTVEDFVWDADRRYLVLICYATNVVLCDFETGEHLNVAPDQMDYSKGLLWIDPAHNPSGYPYDFVTFGRSGSAHLFRIHDEKILALGPLWTTVPWRNG